MTTHEPTHFDVKAPYDEWQAHMLTLARLKLLDGLKQAVYALVRNGILTETDSTIRTEIYLDSEDDSPPQPTPTRRRHLPPHGRRAQPKRPPRAGARGPRQRPTAQRHRLTKETACQQTKGNQGSPPATTKAPQLLRKALTMQGPKLLNTHPHQGTTYMVVWKWHPSLPSLVARFVEKGKAEDYLEILTRRMQPTINPDVPITGP